MVFCPITTLHLASDDDTDAVVIETSAEAISVVCVGGGTIAPVIAIHTDVEICTLEELTSSLIDLRLQERGQGSIEVEIACSSSATEIHTCRHEGNGLFALLFGCHSRESVLHGEVLGCSEGEGEAHPTDIILDSNVDIEVHSLCRS